MVNEVITLIISSSVTILIFTIGWWLYLDREKKKYLEQTKIGEYLNFIRSFRKFLHSGYPNYDEKVHAESKKELQRSYDTLLLIGSDYILEKLSIMFGSKTAKDGKMVLSGVEVTDLIIDMRKELFPQSAFNANKILDLA